MNMDTELLCRGGLETGVFGERNCQAVCCLTERVKTSVFQNQVSDTRVIPQAGSTSVPCSEAWRQQACLKLLSLPNKGATLHVCRIEPTDCAFAELTIIAPFSSLKYVRAPEGVLLSQAAMLSTVKII